MKDGMAVVVVDVGKSEVHCSVCGELVGKFSGHFSGEARCRRCKRDLRFRMQDGKLILVCDQK